MKRLLSAKNILYLALYFAFTVAPVDAKKMYRWVDKDGKVSFSDQVPAAKAGLGHEELDKNGQVVKVAERAKSKAELEIDKRLSVIRKQQEQLLAKQKTYDKNLLSNFLNLAAFDANHQTKAQAFNYQEKELQKNTKDQENELVAKQKEAAGYEIKNTKVPRSLLDQIAALQKKIAQFQEDLKQFQQKKAQNEKDYVSDRARFIILTQSPGGSASGGAGSQPGIFSCDNPGQCDKAWTIAKAFVKVYSTAKISTDSDNLFMSEAPVADTEINLSVAKMTIEGSALPQIFLDLHCTETAAGKALCASSKAEEIKVRFTDYLKTNAGR